MSSFFSFSFLFFLAVNSADSAFTASSKTIGGSYQLAEGRFESDLDLDLDFDFDFG